MKLEITTIITGAALLVLLMSGCAGTPELDKNWGRSVEEAKATQIINPETQHNSTPVEGQQGPVVEINLEELLKDKQGQKK